MKVTSIITITILILLSSKIVLGQSTFILEYKNGETLKAEIGGFHSLDTTIKYIDLKTGKQEKAYSHELESITNISTKDTLVFRRMKVKFFGTFGKMKTAENPGWVAKLYSTDKMEGYIYSASDYIFGQNGIQSMANSFLASAQAIRITSEDYVFFIGLNEIVGIGGKKTARRLMNKTLKKYLKNYCPVFSDKMTKKSYEVTELKKLIDDYTAQCQ